jgi:hypothetical protein
MPRYLSVEQVKDYSRSEIPTDDDDFIAAAIDAAEMTLDRECARRFAVAGTPSAQRYAPSSPEVVWIRDCTSVTSVTVSGGAVALADYQLEPIDGLNSFGESVPYTRIRLLTGSWLSGTLNDREATITVTAAWGWTAIPDRIVQAALIVAKEIIVNRDEVKLGLVGFSDVGGVTARTNPIVRDAINHYRRVEAWGLG